MVANWQDAVLGAAKEEPRVTITPDAKAPPPPTSGDWTNATLARGATQEAPKPGKDWSLGKQLHHWGQQVVRGIVEDLPNTPRGIEDVARLPIEIVQEALGIPVAKGDAGRLTPRITAFADAAKRAGILDEKEEEDPTWLGRVNDAGIRMLSGGAAVGGASALAKGVPTALKYAAKVPGALMDMASGSRGTASTFARPGEPTINVVPKIKPDARDVPPGPPSIFDPASAPTPGPSNVVMPNVKVSGPQGPTPSAPIFEGGPTPSVGPAAPGPNVGFNVPANPLVNADEAAKLEFLRDKLAHRNAVNEIGGNVGAKAEPIMGDVPPAMGPPAPPPQISISGPQASPTPPPLFESGPTPGPSAPMPNVGTAPKAPPPPPPPPPMPPLRAPMPEPIAPTPETVAKTNATLLQKAQNVAAPAPSLYGAGVGSQTAAEVMDPIDENTPAYVKLGHALASMGAGGVGAQAARRVPQAAAKLPWIGSAITKPGEMYQIAQRLGLEQYLPLGTAMNNGPVTGIQNFHMQVPGSGKMKENLTQLSEGLLKRTKDEAMKYGTGTTFQSAAENLRKKFEDWKHDFEYSPNEKTIPKGETLPQHVLYDALDALHPPSTPFVATNLRNAAKELAAKNAFTGDGAFTNPTGKRMLEQLAKIQQNGGMTVGEGQTFFTTLGKMTRAPENSVQKAHLDHLYENFEKDLHAAAVRADTLRGDGKTLVVDARNAAKEYTREGHAFLKQIVDPYLENARPEAALQALLNRQSMGATDLQHINRMMRPNVVDGKEYPPTGNIASAILHEAMDPTKAGKDDGSVTTLSKGINSVSKPARKVLFGDNETIEDIAKLASRLMKSSNTHQANIATARHTVGTTMGAAGTGGLLGWNAAGGSANLGYSVPTAVVGAGLGAMSVPAANAALGGILNSQGFGRAMSRKKEPLPQFMQTPKFIPNPLTASGEFVDKKEKR